MTILNRKMRAVLAERLSPEELATIDEAQANERRAQEEALGRPIWCTAVTKAGSRCRRKAVWADLCPVHRDTEVPRATDDLADHLLYWAQHGEDVAAKVHEQLPDAPKLRSIIVAGIEQLLTSETEAAS